MAVVEKHGCVVERFKQESMTGLFNKEVAVVNSWLLGEAPLYF